MPSVRVAGVAVLLACCPSLVHRCRGEEPRASNAASRAFSIDDQVTFSNQVARILWRHCVECHRPGEIGPFSVIPYDQVAGWADTILEAVDDGRMPPWHANPAHGRFVNARGLSESEKNTLRQWVAAGTPLGDENQLPVVPQFTDGWQLPRKPHAVLPMRDRPFRVPATGSLEYQYFVVDPGFTEDKWVTAAQVLPGNRSVVHHAVVFIRPPDGADFNGAGWLSGYVPGQRLIELPPGTARRIPAHSKLVFQMHYTPNGTAQEDLSRIGLLFAPPEQVTHEAYSLIALEQEFEIPPYAERHAVEARIAHLPDHARLLAIAPHMHLRGRSFQVLLKTDSEEDILLDVPRYDFGWQHIYQLAQPLALRSSDELRIVATFDNSADNPANPDPAQRVTWGDQTWEEMAVGFFEVSVPRYGSDSSAGAAPPAKQPAAAPSRKIDEFVGRFLKQFDSNGDGVVSESETPIAFRFRGFYRFDRNGDRRLTRDEIERAAQGRIPE